MDNTELKSWGAFTPEEERRINEQLRTGIPKEFVKVFGALNWSSRVLNIDTDFCKLERDKWVVGASALVRVQVKSGALHEDLGYGTSKDSNQGNALDKARKAAITDARKRALRCFGELLGNSLKHKDVNSKALSENFGSGNEPHSPAKATSTPRGRPNQAVPVSQSRVPPSSVQPFQSPPANQQPTPAAHQQRPQQNIPQTPHQYNSSNFHHHSPQPAGPSTPLAIPLPQQQQQQPQNVSTAAKQLTFPTSKNQPQPTGIIQQTSQQIQIQQIDRTRISVEQQNPPQSHQTPYQPPASSTTKTATVSSHRPHGSNQYQQQQASHTNQTSLDPIATAGQNKHTKPPQHQQQQRNSLSNQQQRQPLQSLQPQQVNLQPCNNQTNQTDLVSPQSTATTSGSISAVRPQSLLFESSPEQFQYLLTNPPSSASSPDSNIDPTEAELALFDAAFEKHDALLNKKQKTT